MDKILIYHIYINQRKAGMAKLLSDIVDFRANKRITRNREGHMI